MSDRNLPTWLQEELATSPRAPGCYLMRDRAGEVVYVGKANDLRARLSQYFAPRPGDTRFFVSLLDRVLGAIDLIVAHNSKEALILENELIKAHQPRFNVKLKDDKAFLNIRIGRDHPWPRLEVVRRPKKDGAEYFGPYASASAIRHTLRVINRHFQLRTCRDGEFNNRSRPCLEHQIGRCPAPCVLDVDRDAYEESLQEVRLFLQGRSQTLSRRLKEKMQRASDALEFELAGHYRDQLVAIERSLVKQSVKLGHDTDIDAVGLYREGGDLVIEVLRLREGVLLGAQGFLMRDRELPDQEVMEDFLAAFYDDHRAPPDLVLSPVALSDHEAWSDVLSTGRPRRCRVHHPRRGEKRRLIELAHENAAKTFRARRGDREDALQTLERLQRSLHLRHLPARIECYDISNIQGTDPVGSMVVAIDGKLAPRAYRHFKVRSLDTPDDFAMMREVLSRRFRRGQDTDELPDLVLIDGGKGQLRVAVSVLEALEISSVELAGIAKSRRLDAQGQVQRDGVGTPRSEAVQRSPERVFRPGRKNPATLRANSNALFLLQTLRDEAHRFAITHHKKLRAKRTLGGVLESIPGVGPARQRQLLTHFGSVRAVRQADIEALTACSGISHRLAAIIHAHLHGDR